MFAAEANILMKVFSREIVAVNSVSLKVEEEPCGMLGMLAVAAQPALGFVSLEGR